MAIHLNEHRIKNEKAFYCNMFRCHSLLWFYKINNVHNYIAYFFTRRGLKFIYVTNIIFDQYILDLYKDYIIYHSNLHLEYICQKIKNNF